MMTPTKLNELPTALGMRPGFVDGPRRLATPYIVDCIGLSLDQFLPSSSRSNYGHERLDATTIVRPIRDRADLVGRCGCGEAISLPGRGRCRLVQAVFPLNFGG